MTSAASIPAGSVRIPCGIVAPPILVPRLRYALEALLVPLGIDPVWGTQPGGDAGLWYAPADEVAPPGWLHLEASGSADLAGIRDLIDPVQTAWWWLSGEGEAAIPARDRLGRYVYAGSWHDQWSLGTRAPVDEARDRLADRLREASFPVHPRRWEGKSWALCPTHDVDYVRKFRPGILWRETMENLLLNRRHEAFAARYGRWMRFMAGAWPGRDPFRMALGQMLHIERALGATATWFFKTGAHGPYDVGYAIDSRFLKRFFGQLSSAGHEVGLHPGFHAYAHEGYLADETARLRHAVGVAPRSVRTHYLRWHERATVALAARHGFSIDSTLGFPDAPGFRRGTCLPFRLWDHRADRASEVWEMPLSLMESMLFNRQGLDIDGAMAETRRMAETCRRHGGALVALWHNVLWDEDDQPGWGEHFECTLEMARRDGAAIRSLSSALAEWRPTP